MAARRAVLIPEAEGGDGVPEHAILVPITAEMTLAELLHEVRSRSERPDLARLSFQQQGDRRVFLFPDPEQLVLQATREDELIVAEVDKEPKSPAAAGMTAAAGGVGTAATASAASSGLPPPPPPPPSRTPRPSSAPPRPPPQGHDGTDGSWDEHDDDEGASPRSLALRARPLEESESSRPLVEYSCSIVRARQRSSSPQPIQRRKKDTPPAPDDSE